jgi:hypothetical protein
MVFAAPSGDCQSRVRNPLRLQAHGSRAKKSHPKSWWWRHRRPAPPRSRKSRAIVLALQARRRGTGSRDPLDGWNRAPNVSRPGKENVANSHSPPFHHPTREGGVARMDRKVRYEALRQATAGGPFSCPCGCFCAEPGPKTAARNRLPKSVREPWGPRRIRCDPGYALDRVDIESIGRSGVQMRACAMTAGPPDCG